MHTHRDELHTVRHKHPCQRRGPEIKSVWYSKLLLSYNLQSNGSIFRTVCLHVYTDMSHRTPFLDDRKGGTDVLQQPSVQCEGDVVPLIS